MIMLTIISHDYTTHIIMFLKQIYYYYLLMVMLLLSLIISLLLLTFPIPCDVFAKGVPTASVAAALCEKYNLDLPIFTCVHR